MLYIGTVGQYRSVPVSRCSNVWRGGAPAIDRLHRLTKGPGAPAPRAPPRSPRPAAGPAPRPRGRAAPGTSRRSPGMYFLFVRVQVDEVWCSWEHNHFHQINELMTAPSIKNSIFTKA